MNDECPLGLHTILKYAVAQRSESNAWEELVLLSKDCVTKGNFLEVLKNAEEQYKKDTGETSTPSRYRSAKSVVVSGATHNVLFDDKGFMRGKSAVERYVRNATKGAAVVSAAMSATTTSLVLDEIINLLSQLKVQYNTLDDDCKAVMQSVLSMNIHTIWS